jgi:hypothetical protein
VPKPLEAVSDARIVWVSFVKLATALREILDDQDEPAGERDRYLIGELLALFRVEGLIDELDTVVVAARRAYQLYLTYHAYTCQPNRAMRPVQRMAFYTGKEIKPEILGIRRDISISAEQAHSWSQSEDPVDRAVAEIIGRQLGDKVWHSAGRHDVYWLSPAQDSRTARLARPLPYLGAGAFTQGQRYVDLARLKTAQSCDEAVAGP